MDRKTVRVEGIPINITSERVKDKLAIHFLRSQNGSAEIEDIHIDPGPPACAVITFEDAKAARRVLSVKDHDCTVNGTTYRMKVTSYATVVNPNEIFLKVSMVVDCRRFPEGFKNTSRRLLKHHRDVECRFDEKAELCSLQGPYTELIALSNEILKSFEHGAGDLNESHSSTPWTGPSDVLKTKGAANLKHDVGSVLLESQSSDLSPKSESESQSRRLSSRSPKQSKMFVDDEDIKALSSFPAAENTINHLEDFSLVMDSDIYTYMRTYKKAQYQKILSCYNIEAVDVSSDGITTLYLQAGSQITGDVGTLTQAHFELLNLYVDLEMSLRKEQIRKGDIECDKKTLKALPAELQRIHPLLLCHEDEGNFYFIGNVVDVSQAKQYIQELKLHSPLKYPISVPEPLIGTSMAGRPKIHTGGLLESKHYTPKQSSPTKLEIKGEPKLAANFSLSKSQATLPENELDDDIKLVQQKYQFDDNVRQYGSLRHSSLSNRQGSLSSLLTTVTTETNADSKPAANDRDDYSKYSKDGLGIKGPDYPKRFDTMPLDSRDKESSILQGTRKSDSIGPLKVYSYSDASHSLASLGLLDTTKTPSFMDFKPPQPGSSLRRSKSFSTAKPTETDASDTRCSTMADELKEHEKTKSICVVGAEISVDNSIWAYLKDVYYPLIKEICGEGAVQISETKDNEITVLKLRSLNKNKLDVAKQHIEALYHRESTNLVYRFFHYHQLHVKGPNDETLAEWCRVFENCSSKVRVTKDEDKLHLMYPKDLQAKLISECNAFSEKQVQLQSLSSTHKATDPFLPKDGNGTHDDVNERDAASGAKDNGSDSQKDSAWDAGSSDTTSDVFDSQQFKERETRQGLSSRPQKSDTDRAKNNGYLQVAAGQETANVCIEFETQRRNTPINGSVDSGYSQQTEGSPQGSSFAEQERSTHDRVLVDSQTLDTQVMDDEALKLMGTLPDKFQLLKIGTESGVKDGTGSSPSLLDHVPHSLPIALYGTQQNLTSPKTGHEKALLDSVGRPAGQKDHKNWLPENMDQEATTTHAPTDKAQSRSPNVDMEAREGRAKKCDQCKKGNSSLHSNPCGHILCSVCNSSSETCRVCLRVSTANPESAIKGALSCTTMAMSLPGFHNDPSFKIIYEIPDGIQGVKEPNPGRPYKGGRFEAYLPDNREGQKILVLLKKAFDKGHTFKVQSFETGDKVTWNAIIHKTSIDGGRHRNGYPDHQYLRAVRRQLKLLGIE
ncbi:serine-rich adhesin for platelets-like isoform X2 [Ambystoma mexicanum]